MIWHQCRFHCSDSYKNANTKMQNLNKNYDEYKKKIQEISDWLDERS
jgi:hypothetical protein